MLTAEYGGTGGEPIKGGMVVEEPDIEIGAGVSSKGKLTSNLLCFINPLSFGLQDKADLPIPTPQQYHAASPLIETTFPLEAPA